MYKLFIEKNITSKELLNKILKKYHIKDEILWNEFGKPYLKHHPFYFNLSHSKEYTVCGISDHEIGVDIEHITMREHIIPRITTKEEKETIKNADDFTKLWVKKEAYVKYLGIGLSYGLKNVDTLHLNNIDLLKFHDYYIAIYHE